MDEKLRVKMLMLRPRSEHGALCTEHEQRPHVIPAQLSLASGSTMQQVTRMSHFVYIKLFCVALYIFCMARISLAGRVYSVVHTFRLERERSNEAQNFPVHFDTFLLAWTSDSPWH
jgi:hypothetical protein